MRTAARLHAAEQQRCICCRACAPYQSTPVPAERFRPYSHLHTRSCSKYCWTAAPRFCCRGLRLCCCAFRGTLGLNTPSSTHITRSAALPVWGLMWSRVRNPVRSIIMPPGQQPPAQPGQAYVAICAATCTSVMCACIVEPGAWRAMVLCDEVIVSCESAHHLTDCVYH